MSRKLPPDAGTVCVALDLDAGYLADIFRHEAATRMRDVADRLDAGGTNLDSSVMHVGHLLTIIQSLEQEWELHEAAVHDAVEGSDGAEGRRKGDSPTFPPLPSRERV